MTINPTVPEWATGLIDRDGDTWTVLPNGRWTPSDIPNAHGIALSDLIEARGPLRPVGAPLVAPVPPMAQPTELGDRVMDSGIEWVATDRTGHGILEWHGLGAHQVRYWSNMKDPRPVPVAPVGPTRDEVLAAIENFATFAHVRDTYHRGRGDAMDAVRALFDSNEAGR